MQSPTVVSSMSNNQSDPGGESFDFHFGQTANGISFLVMKGMHLCVCFVLCGIFQLLQSIFFFNGLIYLLLSIVTYLKVQYEGF